MSKIGKKSIEIPQGVEIKVDKGEMEIRGPKGMLSLRMEKGIEVKIEESIISLEKTREGKKFQAFWGLYRSLISNMIEGVTKGYSKKLELQGVGFRMNVQGRKINLALGFSHPVEVEVPEGLEAKIEENNTLTISGMDKQKVGQFAAEVRGLKPVEPYKGKGFRYQGEKVRRKVGKKAAAK